MLGRCLVLACMSVGCGSAKHPPASGTPATAPRPRVTYTTTRPCTSIAIAAHPLIDLAKAPAKLAKITRVAPPALQYLFEESGTIAFEDGHHQWSRVTTPGATPEPIAAPVQRRTATILMPPDLEDMFGAPRQVDDKHLAFVDREQRLFVVDLVASTLICVSARSVTATYAVSSDGAFIAYRSTDELHVADIAQGRDMTVARVDEAALDVQARPGAGTFIVMTLVNDKMTLFELAPRTGDITRLIAPVTGWNAPVIAADGNYVLFARGKRPPSDDDRPPMPHDERPIFHDNSKKPDRDFDRPHTCDRLPCSGCGWESDGCGGYKWCGHCPGEPKPPPPAKEDGVYLLAL